MNSPHHDLLQVQQLAISIVPIAQTREANLEEIATKSPESHIDIQPTSSSIRRDSITGVCSPKDEDPLSQNSKQMDSRIAAVKIPATLLFHTPELMEAHRKRLTLKLKILK